MAAAVAVGERSEVAQAAKEEYESYISVVDETLRLFAAMPETAFGEIDMRSLAVNLCRFQDRWAAPLELPFGMGFAYEETLDTPRPKEWLKKIGALIENDTGTHYAGSEEWKRSCEGDEQCLAEPDVSFAKWMKDLLLALVCCSEQGGDHMSDARGLAGCWYYHASETCFVEDEDEDAPVDTDSSDALELSRRKSALTSLIDGSDDVDDDADEDDDEDDEYEPNEEENDDENDDESVEDADAIEEDSGAGSKRPADEAAAPTAKKQKASGEGDYEEDLKEEDDSSEAVKSKAAMMGVIADLLTTSGVADEAVTDEQEEESEREIRDVILGSVRKLHAYMPSPATHLSYYKRMTKKMVTLCQGGTEHELRWFPWGVPPMETILEVCQDPSTNEELKKDMAMNLVLLNNFFAPLDDDDDMEDSNDGSSQEGAPSTAE